MIRVLWLTAALLVLNGCGGGIPQIDSPADGQVFSIVYGQVPQCTPVVIHNNDYNNVTTQFRGGETIAGVQFVPGTNAPAQFCIGGNNTNTSSGSNNCTAQAPCNVVIIADRNGNKDVRVIKFQAGSGYYGR